MTPKPQYAVTFQGPLTLHILSSKVAGIPKALCGKSTPLLIKSGVNEDDDICAECAALWAPV